LLLLVVHLPGLGVAHSGNEQHHSHQRERHTPKSHNAVSKRINPRRTAYLRRPCQTKSIHARANIRVFPGSVPGPVMKLIDVSVPLDAKLPTYPGNTPFTLEPTQRIAQGGSSNVSAIHMSAHAGTHVDAPRHFFDG